VQLELWWVLVAGPRGERQDSVSVDAGDAGFFGTFGVRMSNKWKYSERHSSALQLHVAYTVPKRNGAKFMTEAKLPSALVLEIASLLPRGVHFDHGILVQLYTERLDIPRTQCNFRYP